jgi:cell division protein FtsL
VILGGVFSRRLRGFRVVDLLALAVLLALALGSYAFKTFAGAQSADTAGVQSQIVQEQKRIRLLQAEIAHLEDPGRVERLATQYLGMTPVDPKQEITAEALPQVALRGARPIAAPGKVEPAKPSPSPAAASTSAPAQTAASGDTER